MRNQRKRVYIEGRGFVDISRNILDKILSLSAEPARNLLKSALNSGSQVVGNKVGNYVAHKITDKIILSNDVNRDRNLKAIEELEEKIKNSINSLPAYSSIGNGFKKIE